MVDEKDGVTQDSTSPAPQGGASVQSDTTTDPGAKAPGSTRKGYNKPNRDWDAHWEKRRLAMKRRSVRRYRKKKGVGNEAHQPPPHGQFKRLPLSPESIEDPIIRDLLLDLDKPPEKMSPLFAKLTQSGCRLQGDEQRMKEALVLATFTLEGGNYYATAKRLNMYYRTVWKMVERLKGRAMDTPTGVAQEIANRQNLEKIVAEGAESVAQIMLDTTRSIAEELQRRVQDKEQIEAMSTKDLAHIMKVTSEKGLQFSNVPTGKAARSGESALSNQQLEDLKEQNEEILRRMKGEPAELKIVQ